MRKPADKRDAVTTDQPAAFQTDSDSGARSGLALFFGRLFRRPLPRIAFVLLLILVLAASFAPWISPYDPIKPEFAAARQPPSAEHVLGTDDIGRDILSRILFGARVSLLAALIPLSISIIVGVPLGLLSGLLKGWTDDIIMRFLDALMAFPRIVLIIAIAGLLGPSLANALLAIGFVGIAPLARLTRGLTLSASEEDYVLAARAIGSSRRRIMMAHILPNITAAIIVTVSLDIRRHHPRRSHAELPGARHPTAQPQLGQHGRRRQSLSPDGALDIAGTGHSHLSHGHEHQPAR